MYHIKQLDFNIKGVILMDFISALREFVNESFDTALSNPYGTYSAVLDRCGDSNEHNLAHAFYRIDSVMHIFSVLDQYGEDGAELLKTKYPEFTVTDTENSKNSRTNMYSEEITERMYIHIIDICFDILSPGWLGEHPSEEIKEAFAKMKAAAKQNPTTITAAGNNLKQLVIYANDAKICVDFKESLTSPTLSGPGLFTQSYKYGRVSTEGNKDIVYVYSAMRERKVFLPADCYDSVTIISPGKLQYYEWKQSTINSINVTSCKKTASLYTFSSDISVEAENYIGLTLYGDNDTKIYAKGTANETALHYTMVTLDVYNAGIVQGLMNNHPVSHTVDGINEKTYSTREGGMSNHKLLENYEETVEPAKYFVTQTKDLHKKGGNNKVSVNLERVMSLTIR